MREIVRSILETKGYELSNIGNWLVASKDETIINVGFFSRAALNQGELDSLKGKKVLITSDDPENFKGLNDLVVLSQGELYEDFTKVLFGEKDFESSIFYEHVSGDEHWEDVTVSRVNESGESIIKPFMTFLDIVELSKKTVKGFRYVLELAPHYLFQFSCVLKQNDDSMEKEGLISVNALTGKCEIWKQNFETIDTIDRAHKKLEPKVSEKDAIELARKYAIETSTMVVESIREKEHTVVTEKKTIQPRADELEIESQGLFYLPIWCIEGTNGVMIVDAAAGKIIEEDYYVK
jgi:hypothetical protein